MFVTTQDASGSSFDLTFRLLRLFLATAVKIQVTY